jgi:hypothetical protein
MAKEKEIKAYQMKSFPADLHREVRIQAAVEGMTMKELIIKALREYLARQKGRR